MIEHLLLSIGISKWSLSSANTSLNKISNN